MIQWRTPDDSLLLRILCFIPSPINKMMRQQAKLRKCAPEA